MLPKDYSTRNWFIPSTHSCHLDSSDSLLVILSLSETPWATVSIGVQIQPEGLFKISFSVCVCARARVGDQPIGVNVSLYHVRPRDPMQAVSLVSGLTYPLGNLTPTQTKYF